MEDGEIKLVSANTIKKGSYMVIDGVACIVQDVQTSKPGKHGHSKARITAVGIIDGSKRVTVMPGHDNAEVPIIGKKTAQILSINGENANLMDMESYETFDLKIPEELKGKVADGMQILYWLIMKDRIMKQVKGGE